MLWRALGHVREGRYIDIGAGEPEADSVTLAFYERGWRGVNVEPLAGPFKRLQLARARDVNLNLAVGAEEGDAVLYVVGEETGLSTLDEKLAARHSVKGWTTTKREVRKATLASICAAHLEGCEVHFLKIDAEGAELDVLKGADFERWRPWLIVVESVDPVEHLPQHEAMEREVLSPAGYSKVWFDGLNRFYLACEHEKLASAFQVPPNVFDNFLHSREAELRSLLDKSQVASDELATRIRVVEEAVDQAQQNLRSTEAKIEEGKSVAEAARAKAEEHRLAIEAAYDEALARCSSAEMLSSTLKDKLGRTELERDEWAQELFETNRYAAELTKTRQHLLDEIANVRASEASRIADALAPHHRLQEDMQQQVITLNRERDKFAKEAAYSASWLKSVQLSSSWRITRPIRVILRGLGRKGGR